LRQLSDAFSFLANACTAGVLALLRGFYRSNWRRRCFFSLASSLSVSSRPVSPFFGKAPSLRSCLYLLLIIVAGLASVVRLDAVARAHADRGGVVQTSADHSMWVRTVDGWQPLGTLQVAPPRPAPQLHPFLVAGLQIGGSIFFLLLYDRQESAQFALN